jgi:hypothetical protein
LAEVPLVFLFFQLLLGLLEGLDAPFQAPFQRVDRLLELFNLLNGFCGVERLFPPLAGGSHYGSDGQLFERVFERHSRF